MVGIKPCIYDCLDKGCCILDIYSVAIYHTRVLCEKILSGD